MSHSPDLSVAARAMLDRPGRPPLPALLEPLVAWHVRRHMELLADAGFDDVRPAHNAVLMHLPSEGRRLTELAADAGITKQAMGELVDDLVVKGYLAKAPDPTDGRAKLIVWAERGLQAHDATMTAFATIEDELTETIGSDRYDAFTGVLADLARALR